MPLPLHQRGGRCVAPGSAAAPSPPAARKVPAGDGAGMGLAALYRCRRRSGRRTLDGGTWGRSAALPCPSRSTSLRARRSLPRSTLTRSDRMMPPSSPSTPCAPGLRAHPVRPAAEAARSHARGDGAEPRGQPGRCCGSHRGRVLRPKVMARGCLITPSARRACPPGASRGIRKRPSPRQ